MTTSSMFFVMATLVVGIAGFFLVRTLIQLSRTLVKMDATLTDVQQVLSHAERVVSMAEAPIRVVTNSMEDLQRGARSMGASIDRFRQDIAQPLATTVSVLGFVTSALGITSRSKGGNHHE